MNQLTKLLSNIYAVVLIFGGVMGFIKAHSQPSLITGVVGGLLVFIAIMISEKKPKEGYLFVAAISLIMSIFFSMKYAATHTLVPAGVMLILSATTFAVVGLSFLKHKKK